MGQGCPCTESKDKDTLVFPANYDPDSNVQAHSVPTSAPGKFPDPAAIDLKKTGNAYDETSDYNDGGPPPMPAVDEPKDRGQVAKFQGPWYRDDDGKKIGKIEHDQIIWEEDFEHPPSKITVIGENKISMQLVGE